MCLLEIVFSPAERLHPLACLFQLPVQFGIGFTCLLAQRLELRLTLPKVRVDLWLLSKVKGSTFSPIRE